MRWFQMSLLVWSTFAVIRFIGGTIIDPDWSSSQNVFTLIKATWEFNGIIKSAIGALYQAAVITASLAFLQHCFHLAVSHHRDILVIGICTAAAPIVIPYIIYGGVTLDQYITGLDESIGFALIVALFYAIGDFIHTLQGGKSANVNNGGAGQAIQRNRTGGGGDRLGANTTRPASNSQLLQTLQMERSEKLREFTFYTFLVSLPLVIFWEHHVNGEEYEL